MTMGTASHKLWGSFFFAMFEWRKLIIERISKIPRTPVGKCQLTVWLLRCAHLTTKVKRDDVKEKSQKKVPTSTVYFKKRKSNQRLHPNVRNLDNIMILNVPPLFLNKGQCSRRHRTNAGHVC